MQARLEVVNEVVVVHLMGRIDIETSPPFRNTFLKQLRGRKVVFNLQNLSFVGSSGLIPFFESIYEFGKINEHALRFSCVGLEFRKLMNATPLSNFHFYEQESQAILGFSAPVVMTAVEAVPMKAVVLEIPPNSNPDLCQLKILNTESWQGSMDGSTVPGVAVLSSLSIAEDISREDSAQKEAFSEAGRVAGPSIDLAQIQTSDLTIGKLEDSSAGQPTGQAEVKNEPVDLFSMVRSSFAEKMGRDLDSK
jgi:anti-anti-sigma factor